MNSHTSIDLRWAVLWRYDNQLDGLTKHFARDNRDVVLFMTRKQAREFINERFGYLRNRPDLKIEPHGWKMPIAVRVRVTTTMI